MMAKLLTAWASFVPINELSTGFCLSILAMMQVDVEKSGGCS
jgi:hypothetical protein